MKDGSAYRIDGVCNKDQAEFYREPNMYRSEAGAWVIGIGCGFSCLFALVYADDMQSALDEYADSSIGSWTRLPDDDRRSLDLDAYRSDQMNMGLSWAPEWYGSEQGWYQTAGNASEAHDLNDIRILEVADKVNWFAKSDSL